MAASAVSQPRSPGLAQLGVSQDRFGAPRVTRAQVPPFQFPDDFPREVVGGNKNGLPLTTKGSPEAVIPRTMRGVTGNR